MMMNFPRVVLLQLHDRTRVRFEMGIQEVPVEILNEPSYKEWLELNGAKAYIPKVQALNAAQIQVTEHHVQFLQSRGYQIRSIEEAKKFIGNLKVIDAQDFFEGAAQWKGPAPNPGWTSQPTDPVAAGAAAAHATAAQRGADDPNKPAAPATQPASQPGQLATAPGDQPAPANDPPDKAISAGAGTDQGSTAASQADTSAAIAGDAATTSAKIASDAAAASANLADSGKPADKDNGKSKGKGK
ncbi:MAG TPA: hypothetical protein VND65_18140 [Candidatus Binatia bacterium]|nr:hypothetical protein [Candidatus Binatia bacterium]